MNKILIIVGICFLITGCSLLSDYQLGKTTPLVNGEVSPQDKANNVSAPISALPVPYAPAAAGVVGFLATIFFTWQRGQSIRKTGVPSVQATSGPNLFVGVEQFLANVFSGAFTVVNNNPGITGTVFQRAWKGALVTLGVGLGASLTDPNAASFLSSHPLLDTGIVLANAGILALEKTLSLVPTVTPTSKVSA